MKKAIRTSCYAAVATSLMLGIVHAGESNLLGCWRSQHVEQLMEDNRVIHLNSDCVGDFSETQYHSKCRSQNGEHSNLYTYRNFAPGKMLVTMIGTSADQPIPPEPREVEYSVDGDWLVTTAVPPRPANNASKIPVKVTSLYVRVTAANENGESGNVTPCSPKGPSGLRTSPGPASSLTLNVPDGYEPLLSDPYTIPGLAQAINANFLIGQFVGGKTPTSSAIDLSEKKPYALVVEDYRPGAKQVKPEDFKNLKEQLKTEMGRQHVSCETKEAICFDTGLSLPKPNKARYMTTEFVNVKGRVAIIYGSASGTTVKAKKAAKQVADDFAVRLLQDNP